MTKVFNMTGVLNAVERNKSWHRKSILEKKILLLLLLGLNSQPSNHKSIVAPVWNPLQWQLHRSVHDGSTYLPHMQGSWGKVWQLILLLCFLFLFIVESSFHAAVPFLGHFLIIHLSNVDNTACRKYIINWGKTFDRKGVLNPWRWTWMETKKGW